MKSLIIGSLYINPRMIHIHLPMNNQQRKGGQADGPYGACLSVLAFYNTFHSWKNDARDCNFMVDWFAWWSGVVKEQTQHITPLKLSYRQKERGRVFIVLLIISCGEVLLLYSS